MSDQTPYPPPYPPPYQPAPGADPYHPTGEAARPEHLAALEYHQLDRAGRQPAWAWALLSVFTSVVGFIAAQVVVLVGFIVWFVVVGEDVQDSTEALVQIEDVTPRSLLFLLLAIAMAIPLIMGAHRLITGLSPRWLISVAGRLRWAWLFVTMGLALLTLVVNIVLGTVLPVAAVGETSSDVNDFTETSLQFLLVIVLLVPFQAAAEEYVFRGLMMQGLGSITARVWVARVVAVVVPAFIFALFHGAQSAPIFLDRFAFGVVAGVLAIGTGGIEAGIGYHVVNNWLAFGLALFLGDLGDSLDPQGGNGWNVVVTLVSSVFYLAAVLFAARLMKLQTTVQGSQLVGSQARV